MDEQERESIQKVCITEGRSRVCTEAAECKHGIDCQDQIMYSIMETERSFNDLPNELLVQIFSYLSPENLAMSIQHVNLHWREVSQDEKLWRNTIFAPRVTLSDEELVQHLENMTALRAFSTTRETNMRLIIDTICKFCRKIKHVNIRKHCTLKISSLKKLIEYFPNIEYLALPLPKMMSQQLKCAQLLGQCKFLTSLSFDDSHGYAVHGMLELIADGCPSLQHIYLGYCEFSTEDIIYLLERKKHQFLSFSSKYFLSAQILKILSECTKLEHLHIENNNNYLTFFDVHPLKQLTNLKYFTWQYITQSFTNNLSNFFLPESFSKLVYLDLSHNFTLYDSDLNTVLSRFPSLWHLNLSNSHNLGDEGLKDIGSCKQLTYLNISRCNEMTNKSIEYVTRGCKRLKCLDLTSCDNMTDDVVKHLVHCRKLQILKIGFNKLTGLHFHLISTHLINLTEFHIEYCDSLERHSIDKLHQEVPHLKIIYPFYHEELDMEFRDTLFSVVN